jgi:translation initiation factor IF-2
VVEIPKQAHIAELRDEEADSGSSTAQMKPLEIPNALSVRQLADLLKVSSIAVIKQLVRNGIMANINQVIEYEAAAAVVSVFGYEANRQPSMVRSSVSVVGEIKRQQRLSEMVDNLKSRPPVITIMGHVDHGKTRLLDVIRQSNKMDIEAGSITQHIGAYQVEVDGKRITFLDTPGHEAFAAMRARGARITDITVLVVAADDGVMPQTLEALDHARAAGVPIVVAISKIDKPDANPERVKQQLADIGLLVEGWGGDTVCVLISAKTKEGIPVLLENLLLVAELEELKADTSQAATGVIVEAKLDRTRGPLATVLVHNGNLKLGDIIVVGTAWGKVKAMFNDSGRRLRQGRPSTPVVLLGLHGVPQPGDTLTVVTDERQARVLVEKHLKETQLTRKAVTLTSLSDQISSGQVKELNIILKADVQGSIEPIRNSLERLTADTVKVRIIHSGSGSVTETDVMLAMTSNGIIITFNNGVEAGAKRIAEAEGISIRRYNVIYDLVDDVERALKGMLEPVYTEVVQGRAEVRAIFSGGKRGNVAGVYIIEGEVNRDVKVRVRRGDKVVFESSISSLRRFKENVSEVTMGYECGIGIKGFTSFQVGDILEFYRMEKVD